MFWYESANGFQIRKYSRTAEMNREISEADARGWMVVSLKKVRRRWLIVGGFIYSVAFRRVADTENKGRTRKSHKAR